MKCRNVETSIVIYLRMALSARVESARGGMRQDYGLDCLVERGGSCYTRINGGRVALRERETHTHSVNTECGVTGSSRAWKERLTTSRLQLSLVLELI
jgi:hypothetical protein